MQIEESAEKAESGSLINLEVTTPHRFEKNN
jgi:hypothetical protein